MTAHELRALAHSLPGVEERETWGHPTFRVNGKIFAGMAEDGTTGTVRTSQEEQAGLVAEDPETFGPAPYVGRHGWVAVRLDGVDPDDMRELVIGAWRRTAPARLVAELDAG